MMSSSLPLPPCPLLPAAPPEMDARALTAHGDERDADFYVTALTYGQYLWQRGLAARAILKVDRALLADLRGEISPLLIEGGTDRHQQRLIGHPLRVAKPTLRADQMHEGALPRMRPAGAPG